MATTVLLVIPGGEHDNRGQRREHLPLRRSTTELTESHHDGVTERLDRRAFLRPALGSGGGQPQQLAEHGGDRLAAPLTLALQLLPDLLADTDARHARPCGLGKYFGCCAGPIEMQYVYRHTGPRLHSRDIGSHGGE